MEFLVQALLVIAGIWLLVSFFGEETAGRVFIWLTIVIPFGVALVGFFSTV